MTPDEQSALSLKYSNRAAIVLRLESGAWALFNAQRKLVGITHSMEELCLGIACIESTVEAKATARNTGMTLEELGL